MKKSSFFLAIAAIVALAPAASFAADGTINLTGTIKPTTCAVTTPNIAIALTPAAGISTKSFTGVGSTSAWVQGPNIVLDCTGNTANVYMTVTDAQNPANTSQTMALTSSSTASGLGVQIYMNYQNNGASGANGIVAYGPDSASVGNTNQLQITGTTSATAQILVKGRYIQTAATVKSGSANSAATFTMAYQ